MRQDDNMQVGVFYSRPGNLSVTALEVVLGGGEGNLVQIWACHWNIEILDKRSDFDSFLGLALSSNPEHLLAPPIGFDGFQMDKALYARALWLQAHGGAGDTSAFTWNKVIPTYGLVRPRRQIMVMFMLQGGIEGATGLGLEVYYSPTEVPFTEREEINRKYGKYRRS